MTEMPTIDDWRALALDALDLMARHAPAVPADDPGYIERSELGSRAIVLIIRENTPLVLGGRVADKPDIPVSPLP